MTTWEWSLLAPYTFGRFGRNHATVGRVGCFARWGGAWVLGQIGFESSSRPWTFVMFSRFCQVVLILLGRRLRCSRYCYRSQRRPSHYPHWCIYVIRQPATVSGRPTCSRFRHLRPFCRGSSSTLSGFTFFHSDPYKWVAPWNPSQPCRRSYSLHSYCPNSTLRTLFIPAVRSLRVWGRKCCWGCPGRQWRTGIDQTPSSVVLARQYENWIVDLFGSLCPPWSSGSRGRICMECTPTMAFRAKIRRIYVQLTRNRINPNWLMKKGRARRILTPSRRLRRICFLNI